MTAHEPATIAAGHLALDQDDLPAARAAAAAARTELGEDHPAVSHLEGLIAWAEGEYERAGPLLRRACEGEDPKAAYFLDAAELLWDLSGDPSEIEAVLTTMLAVPSIPAEEADEARLMLALIRLEADEPEEALTLLDAIHELGNSTEGAVRLASVRSSVFLALGRNEDACRAIEGALELDPDDADLQYQAGLGYFAHGDAAGSRRAMQRVLELDWEEEGAPEPVTDDERDELRGVFEELIEDMPGALLDKLAGAPIDVVARAAPPQVEAGADPRCAVILEGTAATSTDDEAKLTRIVLVRDVVAREIEDDDELPEVLAMHLLGDMRRFFRMDELAFAAL